MVEAVRTCCQAEAVAALRRDSPCGTEQEREAPVGSGASLSSQPTRMVRLRLTPLMCRASPPTFTR